MSSSAIDLGGRRPASSSSSPAKDAARDTEKAGPLKRASSGGGSNFHATSPKSGDHTERRLKSRHIQLIGIGGTIGTALYVSIGRGLLNGGPASLFIAFSLW